jgi:hypothetical protein
MQRKLTTGKLDKFLEARVVYRDVLRVAQLACDVSPHDGRRRTTRPKLCRHAAIIATRMLTGASLPILGAAANYHQTSILYVLRHASLGARCLAWELIVERHRLALESCLRPQQMPAKPTMPLPVRGCPMCRAIGGLCLHHRRMQSAPGYFAQRRKMVIQ